MIEAFRIGAAVPGRTLWDGLDMSFGDGEVCVVTGPPGCGKTLLMKILRGARRPDAGDVVAGGASLYRGSPEAAAAFRTVSGTVEESFPFAAGRSVRDLFLLSGTAGEGIASEERERRQEELLSLMGLPGTQDRKLASLSTTEKARIALAAELFRGPKYLFADMLVENAGGEWAEMLGGLLRALAREGKTVVLAERAFPGKWKAKGGEEGAGKGPFRLFRLAGPKEGNP